MTLEELFWTYFKFPCHSGNSLHLPSKVLVTRFLVQPPLVINFAKQQLVWKWTFLPGDCRLQDCHLPVSRAVYRGILHYTLVSSAILAKATALANLEFYNKHFPDTLAQMTSQIMVLDFPLHGHNTEHLWCFNQLCYLTCQHQLPCGQ